MTAKNAGLDALPVFPAARAVNGGQVINGELEDLPRAADPGRGARNVEAVEPERDRAGGVGVVVAHPLDEFAIRVEPAEAMAKSGVLHSLIRCRAATGDVLIHNPPRREAPLDGEGAVAMCLHQALEQPVAE